MQAWDFNQAVVLVEAEGCTLAILDLLGPDCPTHRTVKPDTYALGIGRVSCCTRPDP